MAKPIPGRIEGEHYVFPRYLCPICKDKGKWFVPLAGDNVVTCPKGCGQDYLIEINDKGDITLQPITP